MNTVLIPITSDVAIVNAQTMKRVQVVGQRTDSLEIGLVKAMMIETLKAKLFEGVCKFAYVKKDGSVRIAYGTLNHQVIADHTTGTGCSRECFKTTAYFDIECGGWRSFRWENLIQVF